MPDKIETVNICWLSFYHL